MIQYNLQVAVSGDRLIQRKEEMVEEIGENKYFIDTYVRVDE